MGRGHDLAKGTRTQCSTDIVTESIAPSQERQRALQHSWKASLLRRKWLKNGDCCSNLSLKQIQRMKLLKNFVSSSTWGFQCEAELHQRWDAVLVCEWSSGWDQLPKASSGCFRVSNSHSKEDSEIRWIKRRIASLLYRYCISLGSRYSSAKPRDHTSGGCELQIIIILQRLQIMAVPLHLVGKHSCFLSK